MEIYKRDSIILEKMAKENYKYLMYYYEELQFMPMESSRKNIRRWNESKSRIYELLGNRTKIKVPLEETLYDYAQFNTYIHAIMAEALSLAPWLYIGHMSVRDRYLFDNLEDQTDSLLRTGL